MIRLALCDILETCGLLSLLDLEHTSFDILVNSICNHLLHVKRERHRVDTR